MRGKRILIGVTGSIAAYKSAVLIRLLVKAGVEVKVVMTESAKAFITPLTLSVLSKNPVQSASHNAETGEWNNHVDLALWADAFIIAPASANTIGKMANGICDSHLLACYFSARCPVFIAPAMDLDMLIHPAVAENIKKISGFKNHHLITPASGELASGLTGEGRMEEPENIFSLVEKYFSKDLPLLGKKALVTAGPTFEDIDPVRFIGNRSSGKMGFAIADELAKRGAQVELVTGPSAEKYSDKTIHRTDVNSASEMLDACMKDFSQMDIIVMSAAVADYKPAVQETKKISKINNTLSLPLVATKDILKTMGEMKTNKQTLVGFALETHDEIDHAIDKLQKKNLDFIILNSLNDEGAGFGTDTNKITIIERSGKKLFFDLKTKAEVARDVVDAVTNKLND